MKAFDRACIYAQVWLGILLICAFKQTEEAAIVAVCSTVAFFVLLIYEDAICRYEERAEHYRKLFLKQNKMYFDAVCKSENEEDAKPEI